MKRFILWLMPTMMGGLTVLMTIALMADLSPMAILTGSFDVIPFAYGEVRFTKYKLSSAIDFSTTNTSATDVTNSSVTIVTRGRPVWVGLVSSQGSGVGNTASLKCNRNGGVGGTNQCYFYLVRTSTVIANYNLNVFGSGGPATWLNTVPSSSIQVIDTVVSPGSVTYKAQIFTGDSGTDVSITDSKLMVYELP